MVWSGEGMMMMNTHVDGPPVPSMNSFPQDNAVSAYSGMNDSTPSNSIPPALHNVNNNDMDNRKMNKPGAKEGQPQQQNGEFWGNAGCAFLIQDDLPNAFGAFEKFLQFSNDRCTQNPVYWYAIGVMYMEYENFDFAAKCFEGALDMMQKSPGTNSSMDQGDVRFRLAVCHRESGNFSLSIKYFESVVKEPPAPLTSSDVMFHIALVHEAQHDLARAESIYMEILQQFPQHVIVSQQAAALVLKSEGGNNIKCSPRNFLMPEDFVSEVEFRKSMDLLQIVHNKLVHRAPKDRAMVVYLMGRIFCSSNNPSQAVSHLRQAVQLDGNCPTYWFYLGRSLSRNNEKTEAIHAFARALKLNPNLAEVWIELALEYESHRLFNDAVRCAEKALELRSDHQCRSYLQRLQDQLLMESESIQVTTLASGSVLYPSSLNHPQEELYISNFDTDLTYNHSFSPFGVMSMGYNHLDMDSRIIETEFV